MVGKLDCNKTLWCRSFFTLHGLAARRFTCCVSAGSGTASWQPGQPAASASECRRTLRAWR